MSYEVTPGNVTWVCENVLKSIHDGQFNHGEVMLGIAEALGRVIMNAAETPVQGMSAVEVVSAHLRTTMRAGFIARGYSMEVH